MKLLRTTILATAIALSTSQSIFAAVNDSSEIARRELFFGAAMPDTDTPTLPNSLPELTLLSAKVVAPTSCKGNVGLSLVNAFTDGTLKKIYENFSAIVSKMASRSGAIYLGSLYISKSNPNLYQLITEGVSLGMNDYLSAMGSCESMAESLVSMADDTVIEMQRSTKLNQLIEENAKAASNKWSDVKVEDMVGDGLDYLAENGIELFGHRQGGADQDPINITSTTLKYGWCVYRGISKDNCEAYYNRESKEVPEITEKLDLILQNVNTIPQKALDIAGIHILGNQYLSLCSGCESVSIHAEGILDWMQGDKENLVIRINNLANKDITNITAKEYQTVGFPPLITAGPSYFRNLNVARNDSELRNMLIYGWAFDLAYQRALGLLDALEFSLKASRTIDDIDSNGLGNKVDSMLSDLQDQRDLLDIYTRRSNYTPLQYIHELLKVTKDTAEGNSTGLARN